ncbi:hypothetical protein [Bacillus sp. FJAT-26390]|uniref:hypothetical protein n=1 Tax=Bacillus sp. FJAT-26390 TaxID=1743142 RepID=UPI000807AC76|nr:hypothetical protein [Bacillus sp. FJAT-26390]OBZ07681.1 hypothetical protein A7975_28535 [Bacillus sp. FJAT-26390]
MRRLKRAGVIVYLIICIALTGCSSKPYGEYKDGEMIGFVSGVDEQGKTIEFDISEWMKRDEPGPAIEDWGASYEAHVVPGTRITNEAGEHLGWSDLKQGQKVQINPPSTEKVTDTPDELIILTMANEELLKRAGFLASKKGSYRTTLVYESGQAEPFEVEQIETEAGIVLQGGYSAKEYDPNHVLDVKRAFGIKAFPVFLVFDTEKLALQTDRLDEVVTFMNAAK